jgi:DNA repair exonuclease SbcCD ATPase subunit
MTSVKQLRSELEQRQGRQQQIQKNLDDADSRLSNYTHSLQRHEEAREVLREVGLKTQQALAFHVSDITSLALEAVFKNAYELKVDFVQRRNKTECDLLFKRNENEVSPMDAAGGGAVDVAAFALRVASWSMQRPRTRPVIILDEPMRFLSPDLQPKASDMLQELSQKLGLQFIIVTHEEELTQQVDKVFEVLKKGGVTNVRTS